MQASQHSATSLGQVPLQWYSGTGATCENLSALHFCEFSHTKPPVGVTSQHMFPPSRLIASCLAPGKVQGFLARREGQPVAQMGGHGSLQVYEGILAPAICLAESPLWQFDLSYLALSRIMEEYCKTFATVKPKPLLLGVPS